jgi:hypothetical protein
MKFYIIDKDEKPYALAFSGGKLIGKGQYGCVFRPSIKSNNNNTITKLFFVGNRDSYTQGIPKDIFFDMILNKIDPENRYHIPLLSWEQLDMSTLSKKDKNEIATCPHFEINENKNFYLADYEYGGISLDYLLNEEVTITYNVEMAENIARGFNTLFESLLFYANNNLYHGDVHLGNIMFKPEEPSKLRFIDFKIDDKHNYGHNMNDIYQLSIAFGEFIETTHVHNIYSKSPLIQSLYQKNRKYGSTISSKLFDTTTKQTDFTLEDITKTIKNAPDFECQ